MKMLAFACLLSGASSALEMRETKYPDGATRTVHYVNRETGVDLKEGRELEYHKNGKLKREAFWRNNLKHGLEKTFDEEGIMVSSARWADGRLVEREDTFESENEYGVGRRALVLFNPLPLLLVAVVSDKDLAIPVSLVEFGYHLGGYYALKAAPILIINGEGGWGISAGVAISDAPGSWIGNMFELKYGYYDITRFGDSWNITGSFFNFHALPNHFTWFWGVNLGYGLTGIEIIKSENIETGESRVRRRILHDGIFLGLNGGIGVNF